MEKKRKEKKRKERKEEENHVGDHHCGVVTVWLSEWPTAGEKILEHVNGTGEAGPPARSAAFVPVNWSRNEPPVPAPVALAEVTVVVIVGIVNAVKRKEKGERKRESC